MTKMIQEKEASINSLLASVKRIAKSSLEANIVSIGHKPFVCAGANHFKSLWTRDFCWSIGGLIAIGRADTARNHLQSLIDFRHSENSNIPRIIDTIPSKLRVSYTIAARHFPPRFRHLPMRGKLHAEYKGEHGTYSFDANSLVVLGAFMIASDPSHTDFVERNKIQLIKILNFFAPFMRDGLVHQQAFGDWQDSISRVGASFYTNALFYWAVRRLTEVCSKSELEVNAQELRQKIMFHFFDHDKGLFKTHLGYDNYSLDGQLIAIESGLVSGPEASALYQRIKDCPLWKESKLPGLASWPNYPLKVKSRITRFVGLNNYHDHMVWSWLVGYSLRVAALMQDQFEVERILHELRRVLERDGHVFEIYFPESPNAIFSTKLYKSEGPFSWGAGQILQALALVTSQKGF